MRDIGFSAHSLRVAKLHRFCKCWKIVRVDGTTYRFTDHDVSIAIRESGVEYDYTPAGGLEATAMEERSGTEENNLEVTGIIDSSIISVYDLRRGYFRNATIEMFCVDWQYPVAGRFFTNHFWITETLFDGEKWQAKIEGLGRALRPKIGDVMSRNCRHTLGDTACGVSLGSFTFAGTVGATVTDRRIFQVTDAPITGKAAGYFTFGKLTWTSGNNDDHVYEIRNHWIDGATVFFELQLYCHQTVQTGDTFNAIAGCNKLATACSNTFSNLVNFGGFPTIPGTDKLLETPYPK